LILSYFLLYTQGKKAHIFMLLYIFAKLYSVTFKRWFICSSKDGIMKSKIYLYLFTLIIVLTFVSCPNPPGAYPSSSGGKGSGGSGLVNAKQPNITTHPAGATYTQNATATALSVTASSPDGGVLTYQWYSNTANDTTSGSSIGSATLISYTPPTTAIGTTYYYVVVTNEIPDNGDGGNKTAVRTSNIAAVTVNTIPTLTVTFNSNGGSTVDPITGITSGNAISAPTPPTTTAGGATMNRFRGWYTQANFNAGNLSASNVFNFATPITADITLVADWGYRPGDTVPGGGRVFYRDNAGFTVQGYSDGAGPTDYLNFATYTAYYLEAATTNTAGSQYWASAQHLIPNLSQNSTDQTDWVIGRGRLNTALIIAHGNANTYTTPAASACAALGAGWFLPSRNELNELYMQRALFSMTTDILWSSSQFNIANAWHQRFNIGLQGADGGKYTTSPSVRAIRAF